MSRTSADLFAQVRDLLQDTRSPYRHGDTKLERFYGNALSEMLRIRPDLFLKCRYQVPRHATSVNMNMPFPVDDQYFAAVVDYIVGIIESGDDEFSLEGRAMQSMKSFRAALLGVEL